MRTLSIAALTAEDGTADDVAAFAVFDSTPERFERRQLLEHGFRALTELQRRIVELRFYREWTQEQIAREVGISQMHVSRLLRQALAVLHDELQGVFDSAA
jgi:RNA polymerase sigma-B factor